MMIPAQPSRILMLNLTRMGDLIQSTPLLKGIRQKFPDAQITLLVGKDFYEFAGRLPEVDNLVVLDLRQFKEKSGDSGVNWIEIYNYFEQSLNQLREQKFDLAFNLSHSKLSAFILSYLRIPDIRGFRINKQGERQTDHPWMQYFFTEPFNRTFNTFNLVDIFAKAGDLPDGPRRLEIKTGDNDFLEAEELLRQHNARMGEFIVGIQAGSSLEGRRWSPSKFARLADELVLKLNARILLLGVGSESPIAREIINEMKQPDRVVDLTGKTSISSLIGIVGCLNYLVTNDTGTMHIAAALGIPIIGLFFAHAHPHETGPYAEGHLVLQADIPCAPCSYGVECNQVVCIEKVPPELVALMLESHAQTGAWKFPETYSHLNEIRCFVSEFDADNCLRIRRINQGVLNANEIFAWAYRRLWLDTLSGNKQSEGSLEETLQFLKTSYLNAGSMEILSMLQGSRISGEKLETAADAGMGIAHSIMDEILQPAPSQDRLVFLGDEISRLDEKINCIGLTHPEWKPVTDMFNKRKENIDGTRLMDMARETLECYRKMKEESAALKRIVEMLRGGLMGQAACEDEGEVSSMRIEVPGR